MKPLSRHEPLRPHSPQKPDAEAHLWNHLRARRLNGYKFRRQRPFGPYVLDFVCLDARVAIELDGSQHAEQMSYDERRDPKTGEGLDAQGR